MKIKQKKYKDTTDYWKSIEMEFQATHLTPRDTLRFREHTLSYEEKPLPKLHFKEEEAERPEFSMRKLLGEGGMGRVHLAEQLPLRREVAIKTLRSESNLDAQARLMQEARLTGILEHPNIVPIHQLGEDKDGRPMLVMKRIDGVPWSEVLSLKAKDPEALEPERHSLEWHIQILLQVCHAIEYAHSKQIVHRDLKPENVMIGEFGEVYVLDWGLAVSLDEQYAGHIPLLEEFDGFAGTPAYMAPEMLLEDDLEIDGRTDIYLLGATLHELLVGSPPHQGNHLIELFAKIRSGKPHKYPKELSPELVSICRKAMQAKKSRRFDTVKAFRLALQDFLTNQESHALCAQGFALFEELSGHLAAISPLSLSLPLSYRLPDDLDQEIDRLFWRCHFAFTQALRIWADNTQAAEGMQKLLREMIDYKLNEGDYKAAEALMAELDEPDEGMLSRLEDTKKKQHKKIEHIRELRRNEFEHDVLVGAEFRQIALIVMGILLGIVSLVVSAAALYKAYRPGHEMFLLNHGLFLLYIGVVVYFGREVLFKNRINRKLIKLVLFMAGVFIALRLLYIRFDVSVFHSVCLDLVVLSACVGVYAILQDERLILASIAYLCALLACLTWPDFLYAILGMGHFFCTIILARSWSSPPQEQI